MVSGLNAQTNSVQTNAPVPVVQTTDASSVSTTTTASIVSEYMFRGVRLGGLSFQPSVETDFGNAAIGIFANEPLANRVPGTSDPELDLYGSYSFQFTNGLSVIPGFTLYTYPNAVSKDGFYTATFEPSLAVSYTIYGVTITPKAYYDVVMDGPTFELNLAYTVPITKLNTELDFTGTVGTYYWNDSANDASPKVENSGEYGQIGVSVPYNINDRWKLVAGVTYTDGFDNTFKAGNVTQNNGSAVGRVVESLALSFKF